MATTPEGKLKTHFIKELKKRVKLTTVLQYQQSSTTVKGFPDSIISLKDLEEWEDYEEPKKDYWYITEDGTLGRINLTWDTQESIENHISIDDYLETTGMKALVDVYWKDEDDPLLVVNDGCCHCPGCMRNYMETKDEK